MTRIIDNQELSLAEVLQQTLPSSRALDACVGYFNLRGWGEIYDQVHEMEANPASEEGGPRVRLLVGMALTGEEQAKLKYEIVRSQNEQDEPSIQRAIQIENKLLEGFARQLMWGIPDNQSKKSLGELLSDLKSGFLKISVATRAPLHGKLYVTHTVDGFDSKRAVVGSSNFTPSGLKVNGELNLLETDAEVANRLSAWFDNQWNDRFTADITDQLIDLLENSWAAEKQPSPRDVHLKMAYELSRDARVGKHTAIPAELAEILMPWQTDAVKIASRILETKGLVVVGDVVGLGKTLIAAALAALRNEAVLVLCPKNLVEMWEQTLDDYEIDGKVKPLSMTKELAGLRRFKLIIIDESHNLRNRTRKDWAHIREYASLNESRVILLTATMFNADHSDIADQLAIKLPENLDLGIRPEKLIESLPDGPYELGSKIDGPLTSLAAFRKSSFTEDWQRLISQFMVRRTREYIKERYGNEDKSTGEIYFEYSNGDRFSFPERQPVPLEYLGGESDPGDKLASIENFDAIAEMTYARYALGRYLIDGIKPSAQQQQLVDDLKRSIASQGFIRTTILKRLASSPKAFFITVEKMLLRAWVVAYAINHSLPIPVGVLQDSIYEVDDSSSEEQTEDEDAYELGDGLVEEITQSEGSWAVGISDSEWLERARVAYEAIQSKTPKGLRWAGLENFDIRKLLKDILSDNKVLQNIVDVHGNWKVDEDTKLRSLAELINSRVGKKTLVFSEYRDTVEYLSRNLGAMCPGVNIEAVSGQSSNPTDYSRRFAPEANLKLGPLKDGEQEIDVLLATDVLSEGQNLQDCDAVVNWDLPWTIIKVIQRAGRVDRVGQKAKTIEVFSFMPQNNVENVLRLVRKLRARLTENQRLFGGGERFLDDETDIDLQLEGLFNREADLGDYEGDVDYGSYALGIWDSATEEEKARIISLPFGLHSTKNKEQGGDTGVIAHAVADTEELGRIDHIAFSDLDKKTKTLTQLEGLKLTGCLAGTEPVEMIPTQYELIQNLVNNHIYDQANNRAIHQMTGLKGRIYNLLRDAADGASRDGLFSTINLSTLDEIQTDLLRYQILESSKKTLTEIMRAYKRNGLEITLGEIINLFEEKQLFDTSATELTEITLVASMGLK